MQKHGSQTFPIPESLSPKNVFVLDIGAIEIQWKIMTKPYHQAAVHCCLGMQM